MITKPLFQNFRNSEFVQFLNDSVTICKQQNVGTLKLTEQVGDMDTKTIAINAVFKITQGSAITEEIVGLDQVRDNNLIGIHAYTDGLTYHFIPATQLAAKAILASFDKYGKKLYLLNYQAETSTINSLINDWTVDSKLAAAIVTLKLTDWQAELKRSNDLFNVTFMSRVNEKASANDIKFFELRKASTLSFKEVVKHIEARATIATDKAYEPLIKSLNVLIEKYNRMVAGRSTTDEKPVPPKP